MDSILNSVKRVLGLDFDYTPFDQDIIMHINSAFSTLEQLGVGPAGGYQIEDSDNKWEEFIGVDYRLNSVKTYVCLRVRMIFDPPPTSFAVDAMRKQIEELEWRLNIVREDYLLADEIVLDGGPP